MHLCVNVLLLTGVGNSKFSLANHRATWQLTDSELKERRREGTFWFLIPTRQMWDCGIFYGNVQTLDLV